MRALQKLSLEQKLALLITGVIVVAVASSLALTHSFLTRSSEEQVSDRLLGASSELAKRMHDVATDRATRVEAIAESDAVARALRAFDSTSSSRVRRDTVARLGNARAALSILQNRRVGDTTAGLSETAPPVELWDANGHRLTFIGRDIPIKPDGGSGGRHTVRRPGLAPQQGGSAQFGRLYPEIRHVFYWVVAPVRLPVRTVRSAGRAVASKPDTAGPSRVDSVTAGYVAQQLRFAIPPEATIALRSLTGEEITMLIRNRLGDVWAKAPGVLAEPRVIDSPVKKGFMADSPNGRVIMAEWPVDNSPWMSVIEAPLAAVHERTNDLLETIALFGLLLSVIGAIGSVAVGRRVARPLASITYAAEAIAHGDYARRVPLTGRDEIGRLAASFNQMATEVDTARSELQHRFDEAREAAHQLESSNEQLQTAMREADRLREEAQHANRAKSDFLAVMSHELRTPLNAIGGYAQLLDIGVHGPVTDAQRDALARIARSQAHLLRLINDVLNFARIDAGQVRYTMSDVPLDETLGGLEAMIAPQLRAKRMQFVFKPSGADATVYADSDKLQQIVINLLTNAIKFTPEGGTITVHCERDGQFVRIRVADDGVGMPAERLNAIFDPFVQIDRNVHQPSDGVGLGLAISRDLARGMSGDLEVESTVGEGSVFTLILPAQVQNRMLRTDPRGGVAISR